MRTGARCAASELPTNHRFSRYAHKESFIFSTSTQTGDESCNSGEKAGFPANGVCLQAVRRLCVFIQASRWQG